ncbi:helix-turn-helix transcriptional regulator [Companilactobacillus kimchiensis]|uniref:Uncharacterized protein n=1 Tax=Companilactobacillus kimchiensis TaxID=993692 RepID=A0A0R2LK82_9LACO|nr:WYL domain-containing protein [Companilactobacillus kimchiensis]KRN99431.1 hypothetical protein IV57_GL002559 [Companilactobacillus kimchiensis]
MTKDDHIKSNPRITKIFAHMLQFERMNLTTTSEKFSTSKRTIQRDMQTIHNNVNKMDHYNFHHDIESDDYFLTQNDLVSFNEIFAILKILIGSRAFGKEELAMIGDSLASVVATEKQPIVSKMLTTLNDSYLPVNNSNHLIELVKKFSEWVNNQTTISFYYINSNPKGHSKDESVGIPLSLYFANNYFYVTMYREKTHSDGGKTFVYRLDRFRDPRPKVKGIKVPRDKWIDEESIRTNTYLLTSGSNINYSLIYRGYPQTALDQLPHSKVKKNSNGQIEHDSDHGVKISGKMNLNGLKLWVLSQGSLVTVLSPNSLIEAVKNDLQKTLDLY